MLKPFGSYVIDHLHIQLNSAPKSPLHITMYMDV